MTTTHRAATSALLVLALAAASAPTAGARPDFEPAAKQAPTSVYSRPDKSLIPLTPPYSGRVATQASAQQPVVRVQPPQSGFDWGDAGIGAAGGLGLALLGLGGGLVISHQRPRRTRRSTALPS